MEQTVLITMSAEDFRTVIKEEVALATKHLQPRHDLPHFLTRQEMMELLRIKETKAFELMSRSDFPVCREFGVRIYTDKLFQWIDRHTTWVEENTKHYRSTS